MNKEQGTRKQFRFLNWPVYQQASALFSDVILLVHRLPKEYRFEIGNQLIRSSLSIALNIAEGSGKSSDKELVRFFNISLGSLNEVVAILDILHTGKLLDKKEYQSLMAQLEEIDKQLGGFKKKIKS